jgi:hypothetical protein
MKRFFNEAGGFNTITKPEMRKAFRNQEFSVSTWWRQEWSSWDKLWPKKTDPRTLSPHS